MLKTCVCDGLRQTASLSYLVAALATLGCGGGTEDIGPIGSVSGTVTYQGQPVTEGRIAFGNDAGFGAQTQIASDGTYTIRMAEANGLQVGQYKVVIQPPPPPSVEPGEPEPPPREYPNFPEKYRSFETSGLKADVKEGSNTIDFDMQP